MRPDVLILGQGLAGTLLAWELERAGIGFRLVDCGHAGAATLAAAGIINPITGRRLVKSWRIGTLGPAARDTYRALEAELGVPLWRDLRVRRRFADERERHTWRDKVARGELAPYAGDAEADGFWIEHAARVDLGALLAAARARWLSAGRLRVEAFGPADLARETARHAIVIDCTGRAAAEGGRFAFVPWEYSKGEMLELAVAGLDPGVVINRRHWIVPVGAGAAWVGATHDPGLRDPRPTPAARAALEASAQDLLGAGTPFAVTGHRAGVRVTLPDKRPVAGRHPDQPHLGLINGLGAKGALWAPLLARQWVDHLQAATPFDLEVDVARFLRLPPGRSTPSASSVG
ncbi:MAG: FAD-dependent oxidoreductase [Opitutaceae bacterium]|nr:FAD-dependent oxidoreductase [Opitutaceae bacterium]